MSGHQDGLQAIVQKTLGRTVPYVYCFNHRLHLVVIDSISSVTLFSQYFDQCRMFYNFFRRPTVSEKYCGTHLHRLMEHKWSSHLNTTKSIVKNFSAIVEVLHVISSDSSHRDGDIVVEATGLLCVVTSKKFCFCAQLAQTILQTIAVADQELQSRQCDLSRALNLIDIVNDTIEKNRSEEMFLTKGITAFKFICFLNIIINDSFCFKK